MFEVHTVKEEEEQEALGAGEGRGRIRQGRRGEVERDVDSVWGLQKSDGRGPDEEEDKRLSGDGMKHSGEE